VYVSYIATTAEKLWKALLDADMTAQYWQHENVSDWKPGSRWEHRESAGERKLRLVGKVVENTPPRRLVITWANPADEMKIEKHSRVTFDLEPERGVIKLTVTHDLLEPGSDMLKGISEGWPKVISSLKSFLESGKALPKLW
jgi:uncharacterized protein YndB with AHSA1/START domain